MLNNNEIILLFKIKDLPIDKTAGTRLDSHAAYVGAHMREHRFYEVHEKGFMGYGPFGAGAFVDLLPVRHLETAEVLELCRMYAPDKYQEIEERVRIADRVNALFKNAASNTAVQESTNAKIPEAAEIEAQILKEWERFNWESGKPIESASANAHLLCSSGRISCFHIPATGHFFTVEQDGNYYHGYETLITQIGKFQALEFLYKRRDFLRRWNDVEELARVEMILQKVKALPE